MLGIFDFLKMICVCVCCYISAYDANAISCRYFTCSKKMPGSLGHEEHDAKTFASWVKNTILLFVMAISVDR